MSYKKILIDNTTCQRRFHVAYDDEGDKIPVVELTCLHCGVVVFREQNHPKAKLIRDENLVKTTELSPYRKKECAFEDKFSAKPQPKL